MDSAPIGMHVPAAGDSRVPLSLCAFQGAPPNEYLAPSASGQDARALRWFALGTSWRRSEPRLFAEQRIGASRAKIGSVVLLAERTGLFAWDLAVGPKLTCTRRGGRVRFSVIR
jgi:hypothetical protein